MGTLDPLLRRLTRQEAPPPGSAEGVGISAEAEVMGLPARVEVLVQCTDVGSLAETRRAGMSVRSIASGPHSVVSGVAPLDALDRLANVPGVERVEASRQMVPDLDISRAQARALPLHNNYYPVRGAGVIVGVIDEGIDYTHPDFLHVDGSSRILCLWDQNAPPPASGGVPYGRGYTKAELDVALSSSILLHGDCGGHGTHVCGIAAGNGHASWGWFTGIAPAADIIVVAARSQSRPMHESVPVFDASTFIVAWAKFLGRPVAINLSLGWNRGDIRAKRC